MIWHDDVVADPNSVLASPQPKLNQRVVYGGLIQNPAAIVTTRRDEVDRAFREQPSKVLKRSHTLSKKLSSLRGNARSIDRAYNLSVPAESSVCTVVADNLFLCD